MKNFIKMIPGIKSWVYKLNNLHERNAWVKHQLLSIKPDLKLLDAGCGSQQYRIHCDHLKYSGQDFGQYYNDDKQMFGAQEGGLGTLKGYEYGELDYKGDIWAIDEQDQFFDVILCTEVFEHIPYPIETLKEFKRLLKPGGILLLTAPSNCLRHMDPYFYYTGFSDRWYEKFLKEHDFEIEELTPIGDYYSWIGVELMRTIKKHNIFAKIALLPAFIYYFSRKKTAVSVDTLCMGYHVRARRK